MSGRKRSYSTMGSTSTAPITMSVLSSRSKKKKSKYRTTGSGSLVRRVAALEQQVEKKYLITTISQSGIYQSTPYLGLLNGLARGDTVQSRDGDRVVLGKGFFKGFATFSATAFNNHMNPIRLYVVLDRESNSTALTSTILLGDASPSAVSLFNFNNYNFWKRFKVLADTGLVYPSAPAGVTSANAPAHTTTADLSVSWDCGKYSANYAGGNAGDITDIRSGSVYLVAVASRDSGAVFLLTGNAVQYFKET